MKKIRNRIIGTVTALCMAFTYTVTPAVYAIEDTGVSAVGDTVQTEGTDSMLLGSGNDVAADGYSLIGDYDTLYNMLGYYAFAGAVAKIRLTDDINVNDNTNPGFDIKAGARVTIDLNGHTISRNTDPGLAAKDRLFSVYGALIIEDSREGGTICSANNVFHNESCFVVENGGTLTINGGIVTQNRTSNNGGAVSVLSGGNLMLFGGNIRDNSGKNGGAIYLAEDSALRLSGGTVTSNTATNGGGVYAEPGCNFTVPSGCDTVTVKDNYTSDDGAIKGIHLCTGALITMEAAFGEGSEVHVYTPVEKGYNTIPTVGTADEDYSDGFVSDNEGRTISWNSTEKALLNIASGYPLSQYNMDDDGYILIDQYYKAYLYELFALTRNYPVDVKIKLTEDIEPESTQLNLPVYPHSTILLDLNGHTITAAQSATNLIGIYGGHFILEDSSAEKTGTLRGSENSTTECTAVFMNNGGSFEMKGGNITNFITNIKSGAVNMNSGSTFTMTGGSIHHNHSESYGGAVFLVESEFTMSGGSIYSNTSDKMGGAVFDHSDSVFNMSGGSIYGNHSTKEGGAVCINGASFNMSGGEINENTSDDSKGGGVYIRGKSTFTMSAGNIHHNTGTAGGGVYVEDDGTFDMSGGRIESNYAAEGAGVYVEPGTNNFRVSGNISIRDNRTGSSSSDPNNNVYLPSGAMIAVSDDLNTASRVYVSPAVQVTYDTPVAFANSASDKSSAFFGDTADTNTVWNSDDNKLYIKMSDSALVPVWNWNSYGSGASVTLTDPSTGQELKVLQGRVSADDNDNGSSFTVTATAEYNDITYTDTKTICYSWMWADDYTGAVMECYREDVPSFTWSYDNIPITEYLNKSFLRYEFTANYQNLNYSKDFTDIKWVPVQHTERCAPSRDDNGVYHSGNDEYYSFVLNDTTYYLDKNGNKISTIPAEDIYSFDGNALITYSGTDSMIKLPSAYMKDNAETAVNTIGDGTNSVLPAGTDRIAIVDSGTVTKVCSGAFANHENVSLGVYSRSPVTIEAGAFTADTNSVVMAYHSSGLVSTNEYTVVYIDEITYTATAEWADDYSSAVITLTPSYGEAFEANDVTITKVQNGDNTFSFTASCEYEGKTYTTTLENVPSFRVTVGKNDYYIPKAQNKGYGVFTITDKMISLDAPAGTKAVVKAGVAELSVGVPFNMTEDTVLTIEYTSTWSAVSSALRQGLDVKLYNDITPGEGDTFLYVPANVTVQLDLNGHSIDRQLTAAAENGYVLRVDGTLTLNGSSDSSGNRITGGYNSGNGGGIFINSGAVFTMSDVHIYKNRTQQDGGGIYQASGSESSLSGKITENHADNKGGGMYLGGEQAQAIDNDEEEQVQPQSQSNRNMLFTTGSSTVTVTQTRTLYLVLKLNTANNGGGGMFINDGNMEVSEGTEINGNTNGSGGNSNLGGAEGLAANTITAGAGVAGSVVIGFEAVKGGMAGWMAAGVGALAAGFGTLFSWFYRNGEKGDIKDLDIGGGSGEDSGEGGEGGDDECDHDWRYESHEWEEEHYEYVTEHQKCIKCEAKRDIKHTPTKSVVSDSQSERYKVTEYKVTLSNEKEDKKEVAPYEVIYECNIPVAVARPNGFKETVTEKVSHDRNKGTEYTLTRNKWTFSDGGLLWQSWTEDGNNVTKVEFPDNNDNQTKTVRASWKLIVKYESGVSSEEEVSGELVPAAYAAVGGTHTVQNITISRENYTANVWVRSTSVEINKAGDDTYKIVFDSAVDSVTTVKPGDKMAISTPVLLKPDWITKWADITRRLTENDTNSVQLSEDISFTKGDKAAVINKAATLDLNGKTVNADSKGSFLDVEKSLTLTGNGTLKNGSSTQNGGAVSIRSGGAVVMDSGRLTANTAGGAGGGVYIADGGRFTMKGCEISGNTSGTGGAVYVLGTLEVSGRVIIKDNTTDNKAANVYLPTGKTISVTGKLDSDAEIHVTMEAPGVITSGLNARGGSNAKGKAENFVSDDAGYVVVINSSGEAELISKTHSITIAETANGTITADRQSADKGDRVTLTIAPDADYLLTEGSLTAKYTDGGTEQTLTLTKVNDSTYAFTMPEADVTVDAAFNKKYELYGMSMSLDGDIGVKLYMIIDERIANDSSAYMQITLPNVAEPVTVKVSQAEKNTTEKPGTTLYVFRCGVAAKEMTAPISAQFFADGLQSKVYTFTVQQYANTILKDPIKYAKEQDIIKSMLNYGAYSQSYFGYNDNTLANEGLSNTDVSGVSAGIINKPYVSTGTKLPGGVTFAGATLSLKSETTLSLYFKGLDVNTAFACGNKKVETVKNGSYVVARIRGIKAEELANDFILLFESGSVTYSPMTYCYNVLKNGGSDNDKLQNVCRALYLYAQAAKNYAG